MIKTFILGLDLLKVWFNVNLESSNCSKLLFNFCKARSIEKQVRLIENRIYGILSRPKQQFKPIKDQGFKSTSPSI